MRKEAANKKNITVNGIQGYHQGGGFGNREAYAMQGFDGGFRYYASDRSTAPRDGMKVFGPEIELTSAINSEAALGVILEKVVFPTFPAGLFKMQHDGSLGGHSSAEVIAQPMTKAFIRNQYNNFHAMYDFLTDLSTGPDDSCGMHINISLANFGKTREAQEAAILRLHNWMCDNYNMAAALFKRSLSHTTYCNRMQRDYLDRSGSHYYMCNYSHMDAGDAARVEIRLVGPQKTFYSFRNTFEVMFHIVDAAREGRDFNDPVKLWRGCNECVIDRLRDLRDAGYMDAAVFSAIKATSRNDGIQEATR